MEELTSHLPVGMRETQSR